MIRGSNRVVSNQPPVASFGIHNRFDIEVIDAETGDIKQEAKAYNVICNALWTRLFDKTAYFQYIHYGSGTGTPSATDTSLFTYVGGQQATDATASIDYASGVCSLRKQIQLAAGTAVGVTITEVGIASGSNTTALCTHAMLQDMNGNRVSITKTATDVINIYATVYVHFNPKGYDGGYIRPVTCVPTRGLFGFLCGNIVELPDRMYQTKTDTVNMQTQSLGAYPNDANNGNNYIGVSSVCDANNKTITFTVNRLDASVWNFGGLRYAQLWRYSYGSSNSMWEPWCILHPGGSWFPYSQIIAEAIGTGDGSTVDYSLEFPFVYDMKVYVDGVETTDFTYDHAPNTATDFHNFMQELHPASTSDNHISRIITDYQQTYPLTRVLYNPAYALGVRAIYGAPFIEIQASDDLVTWDVVCQAVDTTSGNMVDREVPTEYAHHKYWKFVDSKNTWNYYIRSAQVKPPASFTGKTLHFNTPPSAGAVITADYKTTSIAKNANNVFDLSVTIQVGEYTGD